MANPITWKNVNNPAASASSAAARSGAVDSARSAFEGMSQSFTNAVKRQQGIRADNRENTIENNTQDFKDLLSQFGSPEEIEAARSKGVFQQAIDEGGRMIDRDVASQASVDNRVTGLRQAANQEYQYNQTQTKRAEDPVVGRFNERLASLDTTGGIDGIKEGLDNYRSGVRGAVEAGELREATAAKLIQQGDQRYNTLAGRVDDSTVRSNRAEDRLIREEDREAAAERQAVADERADRRWEETVKGWEQADAERLENEADTAEEEAFLKDRDQLIRSTVTDFDRVNGSVRRVTDQFMAALPEDTSVQERAEARNLMQQRLTQRLEVPQRDIDRVLTPRLTAVDEEFNQSNNIFKASEGMDITEAVRSIEDRFMQEDEDGNVELFGMDKPKVRQKARADMLQVMTEGVMVNGQKVAVPQMALEAALEGVRDGNEWYSTVSDLKDEVKQVIETDWFAGQLDNYSQATAKKQELRTEFNEYILRDSLGDGSSQQPRGDAPTTGLEKAGQDLPPPSGEPEQAGSSEPGPTGPTGADIAARFEPIQTRKAPPQTIGQPTYDETPGPPEVPVMERTLMSLVGDGIQGIKNFAQGNRENFISEQATRLVEQADSMSQANFVQMMSSSSDSLKELSNADLNKLRNRFGASTVNRYLD